MSNIFNLSEEYIKLMYDIEECDGELTEELLNRLNVNATDVEQKVKAYDYIMKYAASDIATIDCEIERLNKIKQSKTNLIDRLKKVLLNVTLLMGYSGKTGNKKLDYDTLKLYTVGKDKLCFANEDTFNNVDFIDYNLSLSKLNDEEVLKVAEILNKEVTSVKHIQKTELLKKLKSGEVFLEDVTVINEPYIVIK
jgi:exo-beta-1,3-glucanase (GH17 family)